MRKGFKTRIDNSITQDSSKDSDGEVLQEFCNIVDYQSDEFRYVKEKLGRKYDFKFKDHYKRSGSLEQWDKIKDTLSPNPKKSTTPRKPTKPKVMNEEHWANTNIKELSPTQVLERFYVLKAKERRERLLEEVRNVELL